MYLGRVERATSFEQIAKNWENHKGALLTCLATIALGTLATIRCSYSLNAENLTPTLSVLAATSFIEAQTTAYVVQRLFFSRPRESLPLYGPALTGAGAALILAAGFCPALDVPNALISVMGGTALSCYGIWRTATANCAPSKPQAKDYLPF